MPLKLLYFSCHSILEYDDLSMFLGSGHQVFSLGDLAAPSVLQERPLQWRKPLPDAFDRELWSAFQSTGCSLTTKRVSPEFCRLFDAIIVNHYPQWVTENLEAFGTVPVIVRTLGQSRLSIEDKYKSFGDRIHIVRYSEREVAVPGFAKTDAVIYFGKRIPERCEWTGSGAALTFHNSVVDRDPIACPKLDMWRQFARAVPSQLWGAWNEQVLEAKGLASPELMEQLYNSALLYFYIYTCPPSYTLSVLEALCAGVPVLAPSAALVGAVASHTEDDAWSPKRYEVPRFLAEGAGLAYDSIEQAIGWAKRLQADRPLAEAASAAARDMAKSLFDAGRIAAEWDSFLARITGRPTYEAASTQIGEPVETSRDVITVEPRSPAGKFSVSGQFAEPLIVSALPTVSSALQSSPRESENLAAEFISLEDVLKKVNWWQKWEIVPGVFTPGINDVRLLLDAVGFPASLSGARVLDIGGWNGAFSFECERRGAGEVIMVEPAPPSGTGFELIKSFLGSEAQYRQGSIYDLDPERLGLFDIVLCFGIIYHLRYPLLGLDNIRRVCRGELFVESAILETACWTGSRLRPIRELGDALEQLPFLQFFEGSQFFEDKTNWFVPNKTAADAMMEAAGFEVLRSHVDGRYFCHARVRPGPPPMFTAAHEGMDYDIHLRRLLGPRGKWAAME